MAEKALPNNTHNRHTAKILYIPIVSIMKIAFNNICTSNVVYVFFVVYVFLWRILLFTEWYNFIENDLPAFSRTAETKSTIDARWPLYMTALR